MTANVRARHAPMQHVAFLRGINVGGRRVTSDQLCAPFQALGFVDVASFLASGNVTFVTLDTDELETRIEAALQAAFGFDVEAFIRTAAQIAQVASFQPSFIEPVMAAGGKLQVTFLRDQPEQEAIDALLAHACPQDRLAVAGREWYWLPTAGISTSRLDVRAIERTVGRGTTRTMNTVTRLHAWLPAVSVD